MVGHGFWDLVFWLVTALRELSKPVTAANFDVFRASAAVIDPIIFGDPLRGRRRRNARGAVKQIDQKYGRNPQRERDREGERDSAKADKSGLKSQSSEFHFLLLSFGGGRGVGLGQQGCQQRPARCVHLSSFRFFHGSRRIL